MIHDTPITPAGPSPMIERSRTRTLDVLATEVGASAAHRHHPAAATKPGLRVALFHTTLPQRGRKIGGVEMAVHRLANALVEHQALDVTVFSCDQKPSDARYRHVALFQRMGLGTKLKRLTLLPIMLNFVDFGGFDVLHLHGDDWFFVKRNLPTVRTLHGSALFEARTAASLKRKALQYAVYPLEHASSRLATYSAAIGLQTKAIYGADGITDNGVNTSFFRPADRKSEHPLLFYIGTWSGRKRGKFAFETFVRDVLPAMPTARLYMACDHVPEHESVIDGGFPDDEVLAGWLRRAWVFYYPSSYEGFGIPYIEALSSGTAVVTTRNEGADYVLEHGSYGLICDDDAFGACTLRLLGDADARRRLEEAGRSRAMWFSWEAVAARHANMYREAVDRWRR